VGVNTACTSSIIYYLAEQNGKKMVDIDRRTCRSAGISIQHTSFCVAICRSGGGSTAVGLDGAVREWAIQRELAAAAGRRLSRTADPARRSPHVADAGGA
jgi:hypothetical protein